MTTNFSSNSSFVNLFGFVRVIGPLADIQILSLFFYYYLIIITTTWSSTTFTSSSVNLFNFGLHHFMVNHLIAHCLSLRFSTRI